MGFSTTSSLATLPAMLEAARSDLDIPQPVAGFTLPLAASLNRGGSALYQAVALVFLAEFYGTPIGFPQLLTTGAAVFLASLTVAGVPAGSVISLAPAFSVVGLPLSGLSLLIGLDRIPDMFRTMTNVAGHLAAATTVGAMERNRARRPADV
jgi:Na+/H+-dicarboxylate symporter